MIYLVLWYGAMNVCILMMLDNLITGMYWYKIVVVVLIS